MSNSGWSLSLFPMLPFPPHYWRNSVLHLDDFSHASCLLDWDCLYLFYLIKCSTSTDICCMKNGRSLCVHKVGEDFLFPWMLNITPYWITEGWRAVTCALKKMKARELQQRLTVTTSYRMTARPWKGTWPLAEWLGFLNEPQHCVLVNFYNFS